MEFFASPDHPDPEFNSFLNESCNYLSEWIASTNERGLSPSTVDIPDISPAINGLSVTELLDDIQLLMNGAYHPSHPGALAHLDPPPLTASIVAELIIPTVLY